MGKYGDAAILATKIFHKNPTSPKNAWIQAVSEIFPDSLSLQEKGCPRSTYLGLCESGSISKIPLGEYCQPGKKLNKGYAMKAVSFLKHDQSLLLDEQKLWKRVMKGGDDEEKRPNHQMDVVISLWKAGLIIGT